MQYFIENDIPIPEIIRSRKSMWEDVPLLTMEVGQSFLVTAPLGKASGRMAGMSTWIRQQKNPAYHSRAFTARIINTGEFRVWRTA